MKVNIEVGHAFLAGHSLRARAGARRAALGILGSVDANRNDLQSGWDTDQFPNNPGEMALAFYQILKNGGLGKGGFNFDAKVRRQSLDPADLLHGHIGGLDMLARGLKGAAALIEDGTYDKVLEARYAGWNEQGAQAMLTGERTLAEIAALGRGGEHQPAAQVRPAGISREPGQPVRVSRPSLSPLPLREGARRWERQRPSRAGVEGAVRSSVLRPHPPASLAALRTSRQGERCTDEDRVHMPLIRNPDPARLQPRPLDPARRRRLLHRHLDLRVVPRRADPSFAATSPTGSWSPAR